MYLFIAVAAYNNNIGSLACCTRLVLLVKSFIWINISQMKIKSFKNVIIKTNKRGTNYIRDYFSWMQRCYPRKTCLAKNDVSSDIFPFDLVEHNMSYMYLPKCMSYPTVTFGCFLNVHILHVFRLLPEAWEWNE